MANYPPKQKSRFEFYGNHLKACAAGKLRPHQEEALSGLERWYRNRPGEYGLVVMPTGTGKTGVICCLPYYLAAANPPIPDMDFSKPILVVAPDLTIQEQLMKQLTPWPKEDPELDKIFLLKTGIVGEDRKDDVLPRVTMVEKAKELGPNSFGVGVHIVVTIPHKWHKGEEEEEEEGEEEKARGRRIAFWKDIPDDHFSLVIVDEAHHFPAPMWKRIVDKFSQHAKVAFFTATPFRTDGEPITRTNYAYRLKRDRAVQDRIIRDTDFHEIPEQQCTCSREQRRHKFHDHHKKELIRAVIKKLDEKDRNLLLPGDKKHVAMIKVASTSTANEIERLIKEEFGEEARALHNKLPDFKNKKKEIMQQLGEGKIRILIIVRMLLEGFDHPPVSIAAIGHRITSSVKFAQFIGRAQRVVQCGYVVENPQIKADIITHPIFNQRKNYKEFKDEALIPLRYDPEDDPEDPDDPEDDPEDSEDDMEV